MDVSMLGKGTNSWKFTGSEEEESPIILKLNGFSPKCNLAVK